MAIFPETYLIISNWSVKEIRVHFRIWASGEIIGEKEERG